MAFSGALTLTDLNDFITPSQACIKPVEQTNAEPQSTGVASTEIHIDSTGAYHEVPTEPSSKATGKKLQQAQISLNDCLACSGCITSAESVLITLQSHTEVLTFLESNTLVDEGDRKMPVISIAPQSLASLAAAVSSRTSVPTCPRQILRRVRAFCETALGFAHVFDTTLARELALREHVKEFEERRAQPESSVGQLPMLASACPGWICYAEKTHAEMLPFIAQTKSPQQVMGTLVKNWMGQTWGKLPHEIYHVSVMPCYDKKLEASRSDFYNSVYSTRDVDCVITTGELELIFQDKGWDLHLPVDGEMDELLPADWSNKSPTVSAAVFPELITHPGTSSGSYLHSIITHITATSPTPLALSVKTMRNSDHEEYVLRRESDQVEVFKGAKCYGFRNLQNVVRRVGRERGVRVGSGAAGKLAGRGVVRRAKKSGDEMERGYDYVEVMACPGGCVNGGGQLKPPTASTSLDAEGYQRDWDDTGVMQNAKWGDKEWTKKVEESYWSVTQRQDQDADRIERLVGWVLDDLCPTDEGLGDVDVCAENEACRKRLFRTNYRAVESDIVGLAVKW
ncbi:iron hydrogenase [Favolaschia claudopus]|uniref:Cytosolic Fe-S cluster assembly factor NAR1 n=1 Tax=Favolaschia claudopus TaxID=2862362 RepID=A0AAW0DYL5_9AGAR